MGSFKKKLIVDKALVQVLGKQAKCMQYGRSKPFNICCQWELWILSIFVNPITFIGCINIDLGAPV